MKFELLVDAPEFWQRLQGDIAAARERVWLQTLCFEPDGAGQPLADALIASSVRDCRVLMDAFCDHILSDRFIYAPRNFFDAAVRAEARASRQMRTRLLSGGVQLGVTNPAGLLWHRLPARDHRKLVLIDGRIAYIGGINFTDHNFAWHDLMIRIECADITRFLMADFDATWQGAPQPSSASFAGIEVHNLTGHGNEARCAPVLDMIASAQRSIVAVTPYLTFPFTDAMAAARRQGARVTVLSPAVNNRKTLRAYVQWLAAAHDFELRHYLGRMSHLKAMLIDDEKLIVGSSNFDWPTYHTLAETIAVVTDPDLVSDFRTRVLDADMAASVPVERVSGSLSGWFSGFQHRWWALGARTIGRPRIGKRLRRL